MKKPITALLALASTTVVEAQLGTTAYYGIALGSFDYEVSPSPFFSGYSDKVDSWRAMVGYQFNEHLAVEGGYGKTSTIVGTAVLGSPATASTAIAMPASAAASLAAKFIPRMSFPPALRPMLVRAAGSASRVRTTPLSR